MSQLPIQPNSISNPVVVRSLRELDKLIAEHVFNWCDFWEHENWLMGYPPEEQAMGVGQAERSEVWEYSTDISAAFEVAEKLKTDRTPALRRLNGRYLAEIGYEQDFGDTPAIAICLAALKATGIHVQLLLQTDRSS